MSPRLPQDDLDHVFRQVGKLWECLAGKRILFTGASGFFGSWMLESFLYAGTKLNLPIRAIALTRNENRFSDYLPHLASDPRVEIMEADAATMPIPDGPVDYLVHSLFAPAPLPELENHFERATARLVEIASKKSAQGCLLCSTGAVYKPADKCSPIPEIWHRFGAGDPLSYPRIRAQVEDQWRDGCARYGLPTAIARGFAFVGPRLPLDGQFAVGNFLRDGLAGNPVNIRGDGSPVRSYLYAADLAVRLWHMLLGARPGAIYNVGGGQAITIEQAARAVAGLVSPSANVQIQHEDSAFSYYVPDTARFDKAFPLPAPLTFSEALERTWKWLRAPDPCG